MFTLFAMPGTNELLIIGGILFLLFGAKRLPQLARSVGQSLTGFKKGLKEGQKEIAELEAQTQEIQEEGQKAVSGVKQAAQDLVS